MPSARFSADINSSVVWNPSPTDCEPTWEIPMIEVGRVVDFQLAADGGVTLHVFVDAPHDRRVREHTRFWNASGVNVRFDADGLSVTADSLATVLLGGIAFGDPGAGGDSAAAEEMAEFTLHADEQAAFATRFALREAWELDFVGSVRGLTAGAVKG